MSTNQKICAHCYNNAVCETLKQVIKTGTKITTCRSFITENDSAYLSIADNPNLMKLIYDYFLDRIDYKYNTKEDVEATIANVLIALSR